MDSTNRSSSCALPWFRMVDYPLILAVMIDRDSLPQDFESWEQLALAESARLESSGVPHFRAFISPYSFERWCTQNHCLPDAGGRRAFAAYLHAAVYGIERSTSRNTDRHDDPRRRLQASI
jgi:hypothetical protein